MSASDVLHPDGTDYDRFLFAEVGEDSTGAPVTVLSALARLDLEPWTEACELSRLARSAAQVRLAAHLEAITDVPALALANGARATKLVALLPKRTPTMNRSPLEGGTTAVPKGWINWTQLALVGVAVLALILYLAQTG